MTKVIQIPDPISDKFIKLKILIAEDYESLVEEAKKKLTTSKDSFTLLGYELFLCDRLISSFTKVYNGVEDTYKTDFVESMYVYIINLYPKLHHNFICKEVNKGLTEDLEDKAQKYIDEIVEEAEEAPVQKKEISFDSLVDVLELEKDLKTNIIGQKEAIDTIIKGMKNIASGLYTRGSFFLLGPTGVGKTTAAKIIGDRFKNFIKVNCADFASDKGEYTKLIGAAPGYVGYSEESLLSEKAKISNRWIFLFDEIEKAAPKFYDWILNLLDEGKVLDNKGRELDFSRSIFLFTSNKGMHEHLGKTKLGFLLPNESRKVDFNDALEQILESVKDEFSPEFLGRIDEMVMFNKLTKEDVRQIVQLQLKAVPIISNTRLVNFILTNAYSEDYGARKINSYIKKEIASIVSTEMLKLSKEERKNLTFQAHIVNNKLKLTKNVAT